ncbi:methionyl-tRNA formyltransferase [Alkaliphilus serpentinus]|uniref:Methionyl-tRNA formyltransferase n=1 Tax=Alkaliphilus serpentinus TaxID=1482731 RepID=A0A833M9C2_9FIRM|nr:methionyl-tRNA formyltransferase [Alkaliphilus serpentinus]KAB3533140.1 methionyl-tRNA formyltransferase [Alkaliphilus serpentinus]
MRIIFMGTPDFAVPCLEALIEEGHEIIGVFTQPDKPKGRGNKLTMPPVKEVAQEAGLIVYQPENMKTDEVFEIVNDLEPDLIIVVAYGHILPKRILNIPPFGCINVHASLLPKYRGAAPINWVIINGEASTGVTTMYMEEGLDTGDMILKEKIAIKPDETAGELHDRLSIIGAEVLTKTIDLIEVGGVEREPQKDEEATYAKIMSKDLGKIHWANEAIKIKNLIRGTIPWPGAFTTYINRTMKIWRGRVENIDEEYLPGKIIEVSKEGIYVGTSKGLLIIEELQFSGGKRMTVKEYLVGNTIEKGIVLGEENELS